jgi:hypothetical protein
MTVTLGLWAVGVLLTFVIWGLGEEGASELDVFFWRLPLTLIVWLVWAVLT